MNLTKTLFLKWKVYVNLFNTCWFEYCTDKLKIRFQTIHSQDSFTWTFLEHFFTLHKGMLQSKLVHGRKNIFYLVRLWFVCILNFPLWGKLDDFWRSWIFRSDVVSSIVGPDTKYKIFFFLNNSVVRVHPFMLHVMIHLV